ncbi:hypothetical protein LCGC14_0578370 [marine sediment metagenome]|uniref:Uncharacterized protein n=1 Tax=marine sediment metagenome TaxID=412755 RepID=A0A0F9U3I9_9ZZZZ
MWIGEKMGVNNNQGANTNNNANVNTNAPETFFKLPEELIKELTDSNPDLLAKIKKVGQDWEKANTAKRMTESEQMNNMQNQINAAKQKSDWFDELSGDPAFTDALIQRRNQMQNPNSGQNSNPINQNTQNNVDPFSEFEDGDAVKALADHIMSGIDDKIDKRMAPFMQNMVQTQQDADIASVNVFVSSEREAGRTQWPDPDASLIKYNMQKYNMGAMEAYRLSASNYMMTSNRSVMDNQNSNTGGNNTGGNGAGDGQNVTNQNVTNQGDGNQGDGNQGAVNGGDGNKIASSQALNAPNSSALPSLLFKGKPKSVEDKLAEASKLGVKDGKPRQSTGETINEVLKYINEASGTEYSANDL